MTEIEEFFDLRLDILDASKGQNGFIEEQSVLSEALEVMLDAKLVDSADYNDAYFKREADDIKVNAYAINESQERLQLFLVDEAFVDESLAADEVQLSEREAYNKQFRSTTRFVRSAFDGKLMVEMQDADPAKVLASHIYLAVAELLAYPTNQNYMYICVFPKPT